MPTTIPRWCMAPAVPGLPALFLLSARICSYVVFAFGAGVAMGAAWGYAWGNPNWKGGDVDIDVNRNTNINNNINRDQAEQKCRKGSTKTVRAIGSIIRSTAKGSRIAIRGRHKNLTERAAMTRLSHGSSFVDARNREGRILGAAAAIVGVPEGVIVWRRTSDRAAQE